MIQNDNVIKQILLGDVFLDLDDIDATAVDVAFKNAQKDERKTHRNVLKSVPYRLHFEYKLYPKCDKTVPCMSTIWVHIFIKIVQN